VIIQGVEILRQHDLTLAVLAMAICALGSFITLVLYAQARELHGQARAGWIFLSGFAAGAVMWTTHFVGMLAFDPGVPVGYDAALTGGSFFVAVAVVTTGLAVAAYGSVLSAGIGGGIVGAGALAMHYVSISGLRVAGTMTWDPYVMALAAFFAVGFGAAALARARAEGCEIQVVAPLLLSTGICALYFISFAGSTLVSQPGDQLTGTAIPPRILGHFVSAMTLLLIGTGCATVLIARGALTTAKMQLRNIADASVEGLILTDGLKIVDVNESLRSLVGPVKSQELIGSSVWRHILHADKSANRFEGLLVADEGNVPVEVIARTTNADGAVRRIFAIRDLRERREAEQRIRYLAHFDTLTGLPNRSSFQEKLDSDLAMLAVRGGDLALMIIDLDRFKEINDVHGHVAGDELLKETAARIKALLSNDEFAARLAGDEFVVIQTNKSQPTGASRLSKQLLEMFARPMVVHGQQFQVALTIGIALAPRDGNDTRQLLANADLALYRAKAQGRARACFFAPEMDETLRERRVLAQQLKEAIENDELDIHYQAQVSVETGQIMGFEALARWTHPVRGEITPTEFVGIAEETDLILMLGEWVLRRACREAAKWTQPYTIAVNLSPIQFKTPRLPEIIHEILVETGMPPQRLELEITESALVDDTQRTLDMLRCIKTLGVSIAMDDFGTGYSSLSTLQAFPFDKLKIDKSFVEKINAGGGQASVIVNAVLGLGKSLSIPVLAEGVENHEQMSFLSDGKCEQAQGFLIARPLPLSKIKDIVYATSAATADASRTDHEEEPLQQAG
jgi:diguanylate cyclase (GGDEF)-like protein